MNKLIIFLAIVCVVYACGGEQSNKDEKTTASATPAAATIDGKKIYKQYCVTCHGLYGDMGASGAFNLTTSELSLEEKQLVITKGRGAMTPFENLLDEEEIAAVAKYTLELKK